MVARERLPEPVWLAITLAALSVTLAFEHWVIHREVILPALAQSEIIYPWMWGTLLVPELIVCFVAGWRIPSRAWIVGYALAAAVHREAWEVLLTWLGEPGHPGRYSSISAEFAVAGPVVALAYLAVFWLANASAHEPGPAPAGD